MRAAIDWARTTLLARTPDEFGPSAVRFLLHECTHLQDAALRDATEQGLTHALGWARHDPDTWRRIEWIRLLDLASVLSDDDRLRQASTGALPDAVDALEHAVRSRYEPGDGLMGRSPLEHLRCASALLAAFDLTGRLPYSMLAEELLRAARHQTWDPRTGSFDSVASTSVGLSVSCHLARLHADADYAARVPAAPGTDERTLARQMSAFVAAHASTCPDTAGEVGLALVEWFALESDLQ
ncbi:MAG: hypothetical protein AB7H96_07625 [Vicinamibacterales bacterium]